MYNKVIKWSIYLLVFLLPLFFLPFSFEVFEFNKQHLLFLLVSLAFFFWLAKMVLVDKEIKFKKSPLEPFVLAFLFIAILSAIFSVDKNSSIFGFYGRFSDGLIGLLSLVIFYFLITNNVSLSEKPLINTDKKPINDDKKIGINQSKSVLISVSGLIKTFILSVFFVILLSYLSIFGVWAKLANFQFSISNFQFKLPAVMTQRTFNPVAGSMEGLAVFLAIFSVFLIGQILVSKKREVLNYLLLIAALVFLVIIDFSAAWVVLIVSLVLFLGLVLWKRIFKENVNKLLLPILIVILAGTFLFIDTYNLQSSVFNFQLPKEQILDQGESWQIAVKGATENVKSGFFGSGIGSFHYDFAKFRSVDFNKRPLWQIRFDRAGSYIAEILGTMGFLGILSYFLLVGMFLLISYFFLEQHRSGIPLLMAFLALLVGQFVYYQNTILTFTFWLILGLSVVNWQKPVSEKIISFKNFPELSLVFSVVLIVIGLLILGVYFFAGKFYLADINYKNATGEKRIKNLEKAVNLNPYQPQYKIVLAQVYLGEISSELQKPVDSKDRVLLSDYIQRAITYGKGGRIGKNYIKGATELSPNRVAVWETLGIIYRDIQGIATGALEWGIKSFEKAIALDPTNPVLHTELGKLYLISGELEKASGEFIRAKELKSDYIDASFQMALLNERKNNLPEAVKEMESLASSYPFNVEVLFQLGRLYFNNNQVDEAINRFEQIVALMPNHSNAHYSLGVAYQKIGEREKAIKEFEKVLELNPGNPDVQQKLNELRGE